MSQGAVLTRWFEYRDGWQTVDDAVIEESILCIQVNGAPWIRLMCSPIDREELAVGFLYSEAIIDRAEDIAEVQLNIKESCVDVWLAKPVELPEGGSRTTGCGGGLTFTESEAGLQAVETELTVTPEQILDTLNSLQQADGLYSQARGVHAAGLGEAEGILVRREDVGRHNAFDKVAGHCLLEGLDPKGRILYSTGRISSEMLKKTVRMGCPIVVSRTSPTSRSVEAAGLLGVTLVGYARRGSLRVYTHPERFGHSGT